MISMDNYEANAGFRFTPYAWQKLLYMLYKGDTEIGGFGILDEEDPSLINDFQLVKQKCSMCTVDMDSDGLADYLNEMVDNNIPPAQCFRVWIHTHPGDSPSPSRQDWTTFQELMDGHVWFAMLIIAQNQSTFGHIGFSAGPGGSCDVNLSIDWSVPTEEADFELWENEYKKYVKKEKFTPSTFKTKFQENYEQIDWETRSTDLIDRWKGPNHNYMNTFAPDDEEDSTYDEVEVLANKSLNEMTDEEYEYYSKMVE
jgi:hypothetical protein